MRPSRPNFDFDTPGVNFPNIFTQFFFETKMKSFIWQTAIGEQCTDLANFQEI